LSLCGERKNVHNRREQRGARGSARFFPRTLQYQSAPAGLVHPARSSLPPPCAALHCRRTRFHISSSVAALITGRGGGAQSDDDD
jgi:hypothetical protein